MTKTFPAVALAASISLLLSACGGSDDETTPSADTPAAFTSATVQGKAAKGIIISGNVTANELNADGTVKTANVGSAITDANGRYSLTLSSNYSGGPIEISITTGANTVMVCDAIGGCGTFTAAANIPEIDNNTDLNIDFGDRYKPSSLNMTAMLSDASNGETIDVQITPFTHMAAQRARALAGLAGGSLDATTVAQANSAVSNLLGGVNILRTQPVDITDLTSLTSADLTAIAYSALSAAIAELADDSSGQIDIDGQLLSLSDDFNDGSFSNSTLDSIATGATNALAQTSTTDTSGVLASVDTAAGDGTGDSTPQASANAGSSDIGKAYAFVSDLRTWGTVINAEVQSPSAAFETQIELADSVYDLVDNSFDKAMSAGAEAIFSLFDGINTSTDLTAHTVSGGSFTAGTISVATGTNGLDTYSITGGVFDPANDTDNNNATLAMSVKLPSASATSIAAGSVELGVVSIVAADNYATLNSTSGLITLVLGGALDLSSQQLSVPTISSISLALGMSLTETSIVSGGQIVTATNPVTFTGDVGFTVYPYQDINGEPLDVVPGSFTLAGTASSSSTGDLEVNFSVSVPGAATIQPATTPLASGTTYAANNAGEYLVSWTITDSNNATGKSPFYGDVTVADEGGQYVARSAGGGFITDGFGFATVSDFLSANSFIFNGFGGFHYVEGQGDYQQTSFASDFSQSGFQTFELVEPDVNYNFDGLPANVGLQFALQLTGLPEAEVSITAAQTALDTGNANVTISYGTRSLSFAASAQPSTTNVGFDSGTANITITNQAGVVLVLSADVEGAAQGDTVSGSLTIDGVEIASLAETNLGLKVTYIDGTFEFL